LSVLTITPDEGALGESTTITLTGDGFRDGALVYIGGLLCSDIEVVGPNAIVAQTPTALPVGTHDVSVVSTDNGTADLAGAFTVVETEDPKGCSQSANQTQMGVFVLGVSLLLTGRRRRR